MKLLVRNLARTTTENELLEIFKKLGTVQYCKLVIDKKTGNSKGFAFIEMPRPGDAKAAVKTLNGKNLAGNIIRVKRADSKNSSAKKQDTADQNVKNTDQDHAESEEHTSAEVDVKKEAAKNRGIWSK